MENIITTHVMSVKDKTDYSMIYFQAPVSALMRVPAGFCLPGIVKAVSGLKEMGKRPWFGPVVVWRGWASVWIKVHPYQFRWSHSRREYDGRFTKRRFPGSSKISIHWLDS